ncbi:cytochrome P450 6A1-like [Copidosoma floridanum]|uniref:cytochrome P450 6A1-like n=1 Tax=Copidosoma floridanum TaxID=29053 RepID=UPI0006C95B34|nr:cytochrome P450 6A1-like [Copidosoma floridanum]
MEFGVTELLAGIGILFLVAYYYLTKNFSYWKKRNVKGPKPLLLFGNMKDVLFLKIHFGLLMKQYYDYYKTEPLVGIFNRSSPILLIRDPELIRDVLIKDFNSFPDRGFTSRIENNDPVNQSLLNLSYEKWRPLRNKLSPVFSSGKLKEMFYLMADCASHFEKYVDKLVEKEESIECRELTAKYTTNSIGVCAFGLNMNALDDENSGFRNAGRAMMASNLKNTLRRTCRDMFPRLYRFLKPIVYNRAIDFFIDSINNTVDYRKKNNVRRNDFVDLLVDLRDQPDKLNDFEFTNDMLTSQAFLFFLAGFETSSTTMSNALYELALNQHVQEKLREEIRKSMEESEKLTYESIRDLKYLDKVFKETMRKYPPGASLFRSTSAPYTFNGTNVTVPKNFKVVIPVWAIHHDPEIYPNPEKFDPERFSNENESRRHPMNYLAFGDGPHNCIGSRFAHYQTKIGIATIINKYKVDVCDKTCIPYRVDPRSVIPSPIGDIYLKITKLYEH